MYNNNFKYVTFEEYANSEGLLDVIFENKLHGIIIKNFLQKSETDTFLENYKRNVLKKTPMPLNQGFVYPSTIYSYSGLNNDDQKSFFKENIDLYYNFKQLFKINFIEKLEAVFSTGFKCNVVKTVERPDFSGIYPPITIRDLYPGHGTMTFHCEQFLKNRASDFYDFTTNKFSENQLSFFCLLQKPELGGEFEIFNLKYNQVEEKIDDENFVSKSDKLVYNLKDIESFIPELEEGDLIIFNGGEIWHRARLTLGNRNRITIGGFASYGKNKDALYYWS